MKCDTHPRYQVKRKPRGRCLKCWAMWMLRRWITVEYKAPVRRRATAPEVPVEVGE